MKKCFVLIAALLAFFCLALTANAAAGDPDRDGSITVKDARYVLRTAVGLEHPFSQTALACDADHDGEVTVADARIVLRVAVNLDVIRHPARTGEEPTVSMIPATCTENGVLYYRCSCGDVFSAPIPAKGHSPAAVVKENVMRPTCTKEGGWDEVVYCAACAAELSRTHLTEQQLPHVPLPAVKENEVPPTCVSAGGYENAVYCETCGAELSRTAAEIAPLGHNLIETVPVAYIGSAPAPAAAAFGCVTCGACFADADAVSCLTGYYATVPAALSEAEKGDTVVLVRDAVLAGDAAVPEGVTLLVPYSFEDTVIQTEQKRKMYYANTAENGAVSEITPAGTDVFCTLRVSGCTLTVESGGLLAVGGTYSGAQPVGGATYGSHGEIALDADAGIVVKGRMSVMGYVTGAGEISLCGGSLYLPFIITDYHGGTYSAISYLSRRQMPFLSYACVNVQCPFEMTGDSAVYGYGALYASGSQNVTTSLIVAAENALLNLSPQTMLRCKYAAEKTVEGYPDIGCLNLEADGDVTLSGVTLEAAVVSIDLSLVPFSMPYNIGFTQSSGTLTLAQDLSVMPGAELCVTEGAFLQAERRLFVLDGFNPGLYSAYHYPTGEKLASAGYSARGRLTVDGEMAVADGALFAGIAETHGTGRITVGEAALSAVFTDGLLLHETFLFTAIATNRTEYALTARIVNADGELTPMEAGKTYVAASGAQSTLSGYAYVAFAGDAETPVTETREVAYTQPETLRGTWTTEE